jgi:hypothetical protein
VDVVALAAAKRRCHRLRPTGIERVEDGEGLDLSVQSVLEHCERLAAVVDQRARGASPAPATENSASSPSASRKPPAWAAISGL